MAVLTSRVRRESVPATRKAMPLAKTASVARAAVVIAVPADMAKAAATPMVKIPCASAKTSTSMAPEHGRA